MMKIGIYMRLSKEDDFCRDESNSITMQRFLLRDYAGEHFPDAKVVEFADDGYSGTNFERPGIQNLLDMVKNGEINCIIVKDFSRFARDYIELGSYLEQIFPFMGVRFISVNDKYDSDKYTGNAADIDINFKNLLYDLYSKDLSVKIKSSMRALKEQGKYVASEAPFGYRKDPQNRHKLIIAEDEAAIVRRIFALYADGMSSVEIAKVFNKEGVKSPSQIRMEKGVKVYKPKGELFKWQHSAILRMLKSRCYIGDLVQGTYECRKIRADKKVTDPEKWIITEGTHEPIIEKELFEKVQSRFVKREKRTRKKDPHVLVGRLQCGCCGRSLRHNTGGCTHYYWCPKLHVFELDGCVKHVDDLYMEEIILYHLQQRIMELGDSSRLIQEEKEQNLAEVERLKKSVKAKEKAIAKAREKRMADFEAYALGKKKSYDKSMEQIEKLRTEHEQLVEELTAAEEKANAYKKAKVHEVFAVTKLTPKLMDEYIEKIEVHSEEDIRITWK